MTIRTSSNLLIFDETKTARLTLAITNDLPSETNELFLFKIKTNTPDVVAKPSFGIISKNKIYYKPIREIHLKFKGSEESIEKGRLLLNWINIKSHQDVIEKNITVQQLANLYRNIKQQNKQCIQNSMMLPFSRNKNIEQQFNQNSKEEVRFTSNKKQQQQSQNQKVIAPINPFLHRAQQGNPTRKIQNKIGKQIVYEFSILHLLLFVVFAFLFGVSLGIKLQKLSKQNVLLDQLQINQKSPVEPMFKLKDQQIF